VVVVVVVVVFNGQTLGVMPCPFLLPKFEEVTFKSKGIKCPEPVKSKGIMCPESVKSKGMKCQIKTPVAQHTNVSKTT
jgi:hypothetical protein